MVDLQEAVQLLKDEVYLITEADKSLANLLSYPLHSTLQRSCSYSSNSSLLLAINCNMY